MQSTSSFLSRSPAPGGVASSLAAGSPGALASTSTSSEGGGSTFGALISVLVGPASEAEDGSHANHAGRTSEVGAEPIGEVLEAVDVMAAEVPPPLILAPIETPVAPPTLLTPAILGGIVGLGAEISGFEPEPVLGEAGASGEASSTGDTALEPSAIRGVRGDASRWSAHAAVSSAPSLMSARGVASRLGGHGKPAALATGTTGSADSTSPADVRATLDGIGLAASDALLGGTELQTPVATPTSLAAEADTAMGAVQGLIASNTVLSGPAFHVQSGNDGAAQVQHTAGSAEHQRAAAVLDLAAAPFDDSAATGRLGETGRAPAQAAQLSETGAALSEGPFGFEVEAGDPVLREEPGDQGVARPLTSAAMAAGAIPAETDAQSSAGDSHRGDRKGSAAAQLRDLMAEGTAVHADSPGDGPAWSVAAGASTRRDAATDPMVTPRVEASSVSEDMMPSMVPASSPWATAEPAALESGLGGAHANQRFTSMLAHAEEFNGPEHVSKQVVRALFLQWRGGVGEAHVQLHPEHLGHVTLSLRVEHGSVAATVVAETETAQRWIESHRESLQQSLGEQGLKLDRLMVTTSREGRREAPADAQDQRQRRPSPRRTSQGAFEVRV